MEPTPELKKIADELIGPGATDSDRFVFAHALMTWATELRAALLPFERAAELSEAKRAAVERGQQLIEARRQADEQAAQSIGAGKPAYMPKQGLRERLRAWIGRKV